jgi:protein gp37
MYVGSGLLLRNPPSPSVPPLLEKEGEVGRQHLVPRVAVLQLRQISTVICHRPTVPNDRSAGQGRRSRCLLFKQWGAWGAEGQRRSKKANGRPYAGQVWDAMPG